MGDGSGHAIKALGLAARQGGTERQWMIVAIEWMEAANARIQELESNIANNTENAVPT